MSQSGVHAGEAIQQARDFYGKAVVIASRIAAQARSSEILVFSTLKELTENSGELRFDAARDIELKSLGGSFRPYSVIWQNRTRAQWASACCTTGIGARRHCIPPREEDPQF